MRLDMWLPSMFDYTDGRQVHRRQHRPYGLALVYDAMRATGGYYREAYNGRGLLTIMGLSWSEIVDGLEDRGLLPGQHPHFWRGNGCPSPETAGPSSPIGATDDLWRCGGNTARGPKPKIGTCWRTTCAPTERAKERSHLCSGISTDCGHPAVLS